jgi:hypothetical protein
MGRGERAEPKNCRRVKMVSHERTVVQVVLAWIWEDVDVEWVKKSVVFDLLNDRTVEMVVVIVQEGIPTSVIQLSY